ncbi:hypothetical protein KR074_004028 [Drosophila pseudoananassae]|nr:hypothetical protein KR074_004028 [Drosophila pseudoananassae]
MKFAFALCLILASSCLALVPKHPADLAAMVARQQFAVRSMMAAPSVGDNSQLANDCFNNYLSDQTNVVMGYNKQYTGCLSDADQARSDLTEESASERNDLLERTNRMCTDLTACEANSDGLDFFDCYRDASTNSYKTMFTLNSDSNLDFNRVNAAYAQVETVLTACVDEARLDYAHQMDSCDANLTVCLNGGVAPTEAPTETSAAPAETSAAPAETSAAPAETSAAPAESSAAPAETSAAPAETSAAPAETSAAPAETSAAPAESTAAPPESTAAPAESTAAPAVSTGAPAESTAAPSESTVAPIGSSVGPTEAPERPPEEDLGRSLPVAHKGIWDTLKRFL